MTTNTISESGSARATLPSNLWLAGLAFNGIASWWLYTRYGLNHALLWWVAAFLGFTFFRSGYGFTRAWRNLVIGHSTVGTRAHLLWIGLASALMFPVFQLGWFGEQVFDIMRPVGVMMLAGAFLFGIGMQLAGSCTSGSMYRSGSGQIRLWFSLAGIVIGAFFAALHYGQWSTLPIFWVFSYQREFIWPLAILVQTGIVALLWIVLWKLEMRWRGDVTGIFEHNAPRSSLACINQKDDVEPTLFSGWKCWLYERWSLGQGSIILALLSLAALVLLQRPWVISLAFPFWSTKAAGLLHIEYDFEFWDYWGIPQNEAMLSLGLLEDPTSLMNIAFILGATWATISMARAVHEDPAPEPLFKKIAWRPAITLLGGMLMGYGAVIGLGCNIGGFIAAVLSGSLHGWAWVVAALFGTAVGVGLRKVLRL